MLCPKLLIHYSLNIPRSRWIKRQRKVKSIYSLVYKAIYWLIKSNLDWRIPESLGDELALIVPATANTGTLRFICTVIYNVINYFLLVIKSKYKQSAFNYWRLQAPNNTQFNHKIDNTHKIFISTVKCHPPWRVMNITVIHR